MPLWPVKGQGQRVKGLEGIRWSPLASSLLRVFPHNLQTPAEAGRTPPPCPPQPPICIAEVTVYRRGWSGTFLIKYDRRCPGCRTGGGPCLPDFSCQNHGCPRMNRFHGKDKSSAFRIPLSDFDFTQYPIPTFNTPPLDNEHGITYFVGCKFSHHPKNQNR